TGCAPRVIAPGTKVAHELRSEACALQEPSGREPLISALVGAASAASFCPKSSRLKPLPQGQELTAEEAVPTTGGTTGRIFVFLPAPIAGDVHVSFPVVDRHGRRARGVAALGAGAMAQPAPCNAAAGHAGGQPRRRLRRGP